MSKVKNQHLVPKCYLKNFTNDGRKLWLFDKKISKSLPSNINDVATGRYFYDIPKEYLAEGADVQAVEKIFSKIEGDYCKFLGRFLKNIHASFLLSPNGNINLNDYDKHEMSFYLALQVSRTEEFRRMFSDLNKVILERFANELLANDLETGKAPEVLRGHHLKAEVNKEHNVVEHIQMLGNPDFLTHFQNIFFDKIWIIGKNKTRNTFFTSDHPVTLYSCKNKKALGVGYGSPDVEVSFPLSPIFNLMMYERSSFEHDIGKFENTVVELNEENIEFYNSLQVKESTRQVFCIENSFTLAEEMVRENPEMSKIERPRLLSN